MKNKTVKELYEELKTLPVRDLYKGTIIMGTELEFTKDGRLFDMLGYGFDPELIKDTEYIKQKEEYNYLLDKVRHNVEINLFDEYREK